jgi:preprotein translocase subunit YajC
LKLTAIVAQGGTPTAATQPTGGPPAWTQFVPIILLVVIFYVFMFKSRGKEQHKRKEMLNLLKKGDEVQTIGGEYGRVVDTRDDRVLLKVDETSNTKIWYARSAIHKVVTEDKATAK